MSKEIISVRVGTDGTLSWDRYNPDNFIPILCPKRDKPCSIFCPLVLIDEDGEHLLFSCGGTSTRYKTEPFAKRNAEEERHD